jgi:DNA invertase Pin-like site-specific DNA recombinase
MELNLDSLSLQDNTIKKYTVSKVIKHRIVDGAYQFQILFKGYTKPDWVDDQDCQVISEYLKTKNINTAYLICRVSTPSQATSTSMSLEAQEYELENIVASKGNFTRIRTYKITQSAYKNMPKILNALKDVVLENDGIFVWKVDRLSRNIEAFTLWLSSLNQKNVLIYSHQEKISYKENKIQFLQAVLDGQKESNAAGERQNLANRRKIERGDEKIGRLPFGKKYKPIWNQDSTRVVKKIVINVSEEQNILKMIRTSKKPAKELALELKQAGIKKGKSKKEWNVNMIRYARKSC